MIDWLELAANAIWILGCALTLAAVSYAHWEAQVRGERLRDSLGRPHMRVVTDLAGGLFCLGVAATSRSIVEIIVWLVLVVLFSIQLRGNWVRIRRSAKQTADSASLHERSLEQN